MSIIHSVMVSPTVYGENSYTPAVYEEREEYANAVLSVGRESVQVMSDIWETAQYAIVWDASENKPKKLLWITSGTVDATPEVANAYREYLYELEFQSRLNNALNDQKVPVRGDEVKIVRGRKNFGHVGIYAAHCTVANRFSSYPKTETRIAVTLDDTHEIIKGKNGTEWKKYTNVVWVNAAYVERTVPKEIDYAELISTAKERVDYEYRNIFSGLRFS